jgi:hypothetical protein
VSCKGNVPEKNEKVEDAYFSDEKNSKKVAIRLSVVLRLILKVLIRDKYKIKSTETQIDGYQKRYMNRNN